MTKRKPCCCGSAGAGLRGSWWHPKAQPLSQTRRAVCCCVPCWRSKNPSPGADRSSGVRARHHCRCTIPDQRQPQLSPGRRPSRTAAGLISHRARRNPRWPNLPISCAPCRSFSISSPPRSFLAFVSRYPIPGRWPSLVDNQTPRCHDRSTLPGATGGSGDRWRRCTGGDFAACQPQPAAASAFSATSQAFAERRYETLYLRRHQPDTAPIIDSAPERAIGCTGEYSIEAARPLRVARAQRTPCGRWQGPRSPSCGTGFPLGLRRVRPGRQAASAGGTSQSQRSVDGSKAAAATRRQAVGADENDQPLGCSACRPAFAKTSTHPLPQLHAFGEFVAEPLPPCRHQSDRKPSRLRRSRRASGGNNLPWLVVVDSPG